MSLTEYLYVDDKRLDAYIEQISSPIKYERVPSWTVEIGLTGFKAGRSQNKHARPLTRHEKIELLLKYLEDQQLLATKRVSEELRWDVEDFVLETCTAKKIYIPPKPHLSPHTGEIIMWMSLPLNSIIEENRSSPGLLCLLQDFAQSDEKPKNCTIASAYSALEAIVNGLYENIEETILDETLPCTEENLHYYSWERVREHVYSFAKDPFGTLQKLGCRLGSERSITVLYRIREFGPESYNRETISTFGYPVFISEAR